MAYSAPTVLFTGGGGVGNEALYRLLEGPYRCFFGDADPAAIDPVIPVERHVKLPMANDPGFVAALTDLSIDLGLDLLVPGVDEELPKMAALAETEGFKAAILSPPPDFILAMLDKAELAKDLKARGHDGPWTKSAGTLGGDDLPCILKPKSGRGSRAVRRVCSREEAEAHMMLDQAAGPFIAQEALEGVEYTVCMAASADGRDVAVVPVRADVKRGITLRAAIDLNPTVIGACRALHESRPVGGCYNIQGILTPDRGFLVFEVNPRVSTTLCLVVASGIDPLAAFLGTDPGGFGRRPRLLSLSRHQKNVFRPFHV
ncbi:MAG: ATP-grasp domain-containing protein [Magnetovibrionaceae bacterium]